MDDTKLEQYKRRYRQIGEVLNGGNIDTAMKLLLEMQLEQFELIYNMRREVTPIRKTYDYLGTTGTIIITAGIIVASVAGVLSFLGINVSIF